MRASIAKFLLIFAALTLLVPESYARRIGGGRSFGRSSQMMRQRAAPQPPVQRQQPAPPVQQRQPAPPVASPQSAQPAVPAPPPRRQANSGFGGFFTGALIGMGLGSLISRDNAAQSSGASGDWTDETGNNNQQSNAAPQARQPEGNPYGALLLLGIVFLAVRYLIRRRRARRQANFYTQRRF
ncbi:hypothetical protein EDC30_101314 [Paucimonas lemoignei]|uniref:Uncharacterized protein n=1 Tax=Paucimonas lemoignei TaxID=29443 RepID=A0A4R3I1B3_PAULE|nr:hypothetical protein EDC30_101314 [Paucimonas lemoignei]